MPCSFTSPEGQSDDPTYSLAGEQVRGSYVPDNSVPSSLSGTGAPGAVMGVSSGGIQINLKFDAAALAAPPSFREGIQQAAAILASTITDHITVNINIDYSGTGGGAAAGPGPGLFESYSWVRSMLTSNATPGDITFNSLPTGTSIQSQSNVAVWNAQLKLWGVLAANDTATNDASAWFSTDIDPKLLVGVALHELTHAWGRVPYGPQPDVFDLFRFTSPGVRLFNGGATAPASYFSLDGGNTKLADYGQTSDPSDFLNSGVQGGNDPFDEFYSSSTLQGLTTVDLRQLDALGFHVVAGALPVIEAAGATALVQIGNNYFMNPVGGGAGPELKYGGAPVTAGEFGNNYAILGAETVNGTYEVAWKNTVTGLYDVWNTDADGNFVGNLLSQAPSNSYFLQSLERTFHQDLNGDGTIGLAGTATSVLTAQDASTRHFTTLSVSSLFSVSDADRSAVQSYEFWDSDGTWANGNLTLNGVAEGKNQSISISADQLANLKFQAGFIPDVLWVRASDEIDWSDWKNININVPPNSPPVVAAHDTQNVHDHVVSASSLFSFGDPDGDAVLRFEFWDSTEDPASGHFVVNGVTQGQNQSIPVSASQLASTTFNGGTVSDQLWVRASDGLDWSSWQSFQFKATPDVAPVVSVVDSSVVHGSSIAAAQLFSVSDADPDPIQRYEFWDSTEAQTSGHFVIGGVAQGQNQSIIVWANQLSQTTFQAGTVPGTDHLWVRASDGWLWSDWHDFHVITT
jgi:hypothetical protein